MRSRRGRRWIVLACLLLAAVSPATAFLPHTDDGCPTELHCAVCRTSLAGTAMQVAVPALVREASIEVAPPEPAPRVRDADTPRTPALRGPPAA